MTNPHSHPHPSLQPFPQQPHWTQPPPSPPAQSTPIQTAFPRLAGTVESLSLAGLALQPGLAPLPTPSPSGGGGVGGSGSGAGNLGMHAAGLLNPPTPAPSPSPRRLVRGAWDGVGAGAGAGVGAGVGGVGAGQGVEAESDEEMMRGNWKGKGRRAVDCDDMIEQFNTLSPSERFNFLSSLIGELRLNEALVVSRKIEPLLRRDFLAELPTELALLCLSFVDEPRTLARVSQVSRYWNSLLQDEATWKQLFDRHHCPPPPAVVSRSEARRLPTAQSKSSQVQTSSQKRMTHFGLEKRVFNLQSGVKTTERNGTFKAQFKNAYLTESNWINGGLLLAKHISADDSVVTTLCFNDQYIIVGMANSKIHVFNAATGSYKRSFTGHNQGVWAMVLISAPAKLEKRAGRHRERDAAQGREHVDPFAWGYGGKASDTYRDQGQSRRSSFNGQTHERYAPRGTEYGAEAGPSSSSGHEGWLGQEWQGWRALARPNTAMGFSQAYPGVPEDASEENGEAGDEGEEGPKRLKQSDVCGSARGWSGMKHGIVVSGGCDREVRVWNVETGDCILRLPGHTSTIRCLKVVDGRPIAVSGSRDYTLKVWDIEKGELLHTLSGHEHSVRCVEVAGNMAVSGSYDHCARLWNLDTGECLQVFQGHYAEIYSVAFDGLIVVTGSLDSTVRVWSASTGECLALLQGHTALVGQLQLTGSRLITGGSDGRIIIFDLSSMSCIHRLCAHDNSVTCLQYDDRFIVSGGNDGRVKLWDVRTGRFVRELTRPSDAVWRVSFKNDRIVVLCQREGRTCLEVVSFRVGEGERKPGRVRAPRE
ncbi:hypothetical protein IAT38_007306 [Cryptococcus sp. DSM 104549]